MLAFSVGGNYICIVWIRRLLILISRLVALLNQYPEMLRCDGLGYIRICYDSCWGFTCDMLVDISDGSCLQLLDQNFEVNFTYYLDKGNRKQKFLLC